MEKITPGSELSQSSDFVNDNIQILKNLFPTIVKEGKIDIEELKALLGQEIEEEEEYYRFTWAGKSNARREANKPSTATLRPDFESSKEWDTTQNIFIEGDNLEVLKLLQKSYSNKIKMIYIDVPYNTGKDFVYKDNYNDNLSNYLAITGQLDESGKRSSTNSESDGRFHSNWLNMMYPRLKLARNLMNEEGVIFISIDDNEVSNLKKCCDEIFGEENFIASFIWNKQHSQQQGIVKKYHEYILLYSKFIEKIKLIEGGEGEIVAGALKKISKSNPESEFTFKKGTKIEAKDGTRFSGTYGDSEKVTVVDGEFIVENNMLKNDVTLSAGWTQKNQMISWFNGLETFDTKGQRIIEFYFNAEGKLKCKKERNVITPPSLLPEFGMSSKHTQQLAQLMGASVFENPKPVDLISLLLSWFCNENEIILDFFAGSGTTAHSVMQLNSEDYANRKFICVQLPELTTENSEAFKAGYLKISDITKDRINKAGEKIKAERSSDLFSQDGNLLDVGFRVFKLDSSNINAWDGDPENIEKTLFNASNNIKEGRSENDVLYEILLKFGLDLTQPIDKKSIASKTVYSIGGGTLFICLGDDLTTEIAEGIGEWKNELQPVNTKVIFKDNGFTDVEKTNCMQILKRFGIEEVNTI